VQAAILASREDGWAMAEDFLERWENVSRQVGTQSSPRWLHRYWGKVMREAEAAPLRPWRAPD